MSKSTQNQEVQGRSGNVVARGFHRWLDQNRAYGEAFTRFAAPGYKGE